MALSDFFKKKKEDVKEDSIDLLEAALNEPIKYIPNEEIEDSIYDDKDYIKDLEERNEDLNSKFIDSLIDLNKYSKQELKLFERIEELRRLNTSLEIENKFLKSKIEDLNKDIDLNKMFRNLDKKLYDLNEYLKSKDVILNDDDDEDKEEYLDPKSKILKLLKGKDKDIYKNPKTKSGFSVSKIQRDTNLSQFTVYKYLRKIKEDML